MTSALWLDRARGHHSGVKRQWFGRREGLHLDAYMAVRSIDG